MVSKSNYSLASIVWCLLVMTISVSVTSLANAQNVAYTLRNGQLVEGVGGTVSEISVSLAVGDPNESHTIVMLEDGLKRTFFSKNEIANQGESTLSDIEIEFGQRVNRASRVGYGFLRQADPFNEDGHRVIWVEVAKSDGSGTEVKPVMQGITRLNPYWAEVKTLVVPDEISDRFSKRRWEMRLATSSIPPNVLRSLLHRSVDTNSPSDRLNIIYFYLAAEQYRRAAEELAEMERDFPDARKNFEADRIDIKQAYGRQVLEEIRFRESVGQVKLAEAMAAAIDTEDMAGSIQKDFDDFRINTIARVNREIESSKKGFLDFARAFIASHDNQPDQQKAAQQLADEVEANLSRNNIDRLASYERIKADTTQSQDQLMALAISGWILGSNNAIDNLAVAESLFIVRGLVHEYLSTATRARRSEILQELTKYESSDPKYLSRLINNLAPPKAPEMANYTGEKPIEFDVVVKGTKIQKGMDQTFRVLVHLPPEYDPYRKYPCLMTLGSDISAEEQLNRWAGGYNPRLGIRNGPAMRHGYIVVSVDWKEPGQSRYMYSAREHQVILKAMRECLRKFSIDSDRFFLSGHGAGADAAYDIAISHPEHWAGVIGISGTIKKYPIQYKRNRHPPLNVYSVVGSKENQKIDESADAWNTWLGTRGAKRCQVVQYMGRLNEHFYEEFPSILKWCDVSRRSWPNAAEVTKLDCKSLRPWDNYFWFVELKGIPRERVVWPANWPANGQGFDKKSVKIGVTLQNNAFKNISPSNQGTGMVFWLSEDYIDFTKEVRINNRGGGFRGYVKPSREVMLESVRTRGDRKRPFWAKVSLK